MHRAHPPACKSNIFSRTCDTGLPPSTSNNLNNDHKYRLDEQAAQQLQYELDAHVAGLESKPNPTTQQSSAAKPKSKAPARKTPFDLQADYIPFDSNLGDGWKEVEVNVEKKTTGGPPKRLRYGDYTMK